MRAQTLFALLPILTSPLASQVPAGRDSTTRDTALVRLPEITVTVTRSPEQLASVPAAIGVVGLRDLRGNQSTLGLDESLNNLPGVYVANRYNYALDQRLSIRGAGSRANFGLRGVKVILDGIPQTLPDGQSQLTNVDFGNLSRIEVLRGASSSLYGNASGGVLSLTTEPAGPGPFATSLRAEGGSFGLFRIQSRTGARRGNASGTLSLSRTQVDGYRQHSETEFTQLNLNGEYLFGGATVAQLRLAYTDAPQAQNPGALTLAEVLAKPDSAAASNINRKADKDLSQAQLGLTLRHYTRRGEWSVTAFGLDRALDNWQATPPPQGTGRDIGIFTNIGRIVYGVRLGGEQRLGDGAAAPRITAGVDLQRMRDDRHSWRDTAGVRDTTILDQRETVTEVGPFVQLHWSPAADWVIGAGGRYDAVTFKVDDHFLGDGTDNSGSRTMSAFSGNVGLAFVADPRVSPYLNLSTSFETPTTTELANQPNSTGGFNSGLDPQRTVNYELGGRGSVGPLTWSVAGFLSRVTDAIVQYQEVSGRGYFTNAGRLKNDGIELGLAVRAERRLGLFGNYTYANYRFGTYRVVSGTTTDTLDGKRLPGVPQGFIRLGLRAGPVHGVTLDVDHTMATSIYADDKNTLFVAGFGSNQPGEVRGLGSGVTNARIGWRGDVGGAWFTPFLGVNNLWDRGYASGLTLNGAGGRVFETAPGRNWFLGAELGWAR